MIPAKSALEASFSVIALLWHDIAHSGVGRQNKSLHHLNPPDGRLSAHAAARKPGRTTEVIGFELAFMICGCP